jgi:hypothetical protein
MKILFICGSLEDGYDGVGDYTRRLASSLTSKGHTIAIIALNDRYITTKFVGLQDSLNNQIPVLRLPSVLAPRDRLLQAKEWIEVFNPQLISLQFVIYSFNKNGLPISLKQQISKLGFKYKWHVMFHELWIGVSKHRYLKSLFISAVQKSIISAVLKCIRPVMIHTHLPEYSNKLHKLGWKVKSLPLFSNIDDVEDSGCYGHDKIIRVGFFGQTELNYSVVNFLKDLKKEALKIEIILIGGNKSKMEKIGDELMQLKISDVPMISTGYLNAKQISNLIKKCTIGITPVPRHGLGKSGSVAAFIAHGVPVAAPFVYKGYSVDEIGFDSKSLCSSIILSPTINSIKIARHNAKIAKDEIKVHKVADNFLNDIIG